MQVINHSLEKTILEADGRYLNTQELQPLEQYLRTYVSRMQAYQALRDESDKLVMQALRKLAQTHPDVVQKHGQRCKYDMSEVLRYIALAILRDDSIYFKEQMSDWLDTILLAHRRNTQCATAYHDLKDVIQATLPGSVNDIVRPYLEILINTLQSHA